MRKIRWGLIGCGDIARKRVAPALRDLKNCTLQAVTRKRSELAADFAQEFGATKWYGEWRELLNDDQIDAVYVATPVYLHAQQTIEAAQAGKHVICEKPMAMNPDECDSMVEACKAHGVRLSIAYYRHLYPVVSRIKKMLAENQIGTVVLAQINAFEWFDMTEGHPRGWLFKKELSGGGPMMDFGSHRIEVLHNLFGPVLSTLGVTGNVLFEAEVEDTTCALFQFQNGTYGVLSVSAAVSEASDSLDLYGSGGSIHVPVLNEGTLELVSKESRRVEHHPPHKNLHLPYIDAVTEAILEDREPPVAGEAGREVARIVQEIYRD